MPTGKIKLYNDKKGYGFIQPDDGDSDIFFHISAAREGDDIEKGAKVSFEIGTDKRTGKPKAVVVNLL